MTTATSAMMRIAASNGLMGKEVMAFGAAQERGAERHAPDFALYPGYPCTTQNQVNIR
jgi:hypothetical protein